jgi:A/G-specific adenine glycosylase
MMELGATVCSPKSPSCSTCPVKGLCAAKNLNAATIVDIEDTCVKCGKANLKFEDGVLNYPRLFQSF